MVLTYQLPLVIDPPAVHDCRELGWKNTEGITNNYCGYSSTRRRNFLKSLPLGQIILKRAV